MDNDENKEKHLISGTNAIERFLISLFFIEVIGQTLTALTSHLLRLAGQPWLYNQIHSIPYFHHILFTALLAVAIALNVKQIINKRDKKQTY